MLLGSVDERLKPMVNWLVQIWLSIPLSALFLTHSVIGICETGSRNLSN